MNNTLIDKEIGSNSYLKNKKTENYFRVYVKAKDEFKVFKEVFIQYFDGLWESETNEVEIGTFKTEDEVYSVMD